VIFERLLRPALFRLSGGDAEAAHDRTLQALGRLAHHPAALAALRARYGVAAPTRVFGIDFPNPVGLAAGMDKDGLALPVWPALGFGFVEVGTVTWHPQPGNDRPRLWRRPEREAIVNRMGFNNRGARALAGRLRAYPAAPAGGEGGAAKPPAPVPGGASAPVVGVSVGKSKVAPLDQAVGDYLRSVRVLEPYASYFAVNVSSPNTPGLRRLQDPGHLDALLAAVGTGGKPVLVKIAPDLTEHAIVELLQVCAARGAAGVIATNTTATDRGGLSGRPLTARAREVVRLVRKHCQLPVIGVGGILSVDDASRMFDAGASLVQLYTGFVYHGPALVRRIATSRRGATPGPGRMPGAVDPRAGMTAG
jgi:dihydroorotate dehydrogenase